jgi:ATP-dependent helicase HrpB
MPGSLSRCTIWSGGLPHLVQGWEVSGSPGELPIDASLGEIRSLVARHRRLVLTAPPGAGKSTRVPPLLLARGPVFLLQPRRVAARSLAKRIAEENGWSVGGEVGFQVRFERAYGRQTRLLVATEGILTARLEADPLLSDFATVVLDEFHERTIHADLALAFVKQAIAARDDLAVVVMSATLGSEAARVAAYLGGCPVLDVPGRPHPVDVRYLPGAGLGAAVQERLRAPGRHILCFLPGAREIREAAREMAPALPSGARMVPLHGSLEARDQDAALAFSDERKVILATNIAETSLTIDGVTDVVDTGLHKVLRYDPEKGIDRLETERISQDSAAQRAGRAGRTGPGNALRLWDERDRLREHREPDVERIDLASAVLDVLAWGGDLERFDWYEAPPAERLRQGLYLLTLLGAVREGRVTALGRTLRGFPLHPRLARVLVGAGGGARAAAACALLGERPYPFSGTAVTDSDVLSRVDQLERAPPGVKQAAREIEALARRVFGAPPQEASDATIRKALLAGYPDRLARRRAPGSDRFLLASGYGAVLGRESQVRAAELIVALDVVAGPPGRGSEAIVRMASQVERDWLGPVEHEVVHRFDPEAEAVKAFELSRFSGLVLGERPVPADPEMASEILRAELARRGLPEEAAMILRRARFAGLDLDPETLLRDACRGRTRLAAVDVAGSVPARLRAELDRLAPLRLSVPSGRSVPLDYGEDGAVVAAVKLQELFGLEETPRLGPRREPVTLSLLAPNGRPVQTTSDLRSFWQRTYPEVRKELRGRYPRHPWPEDPWSALPTHRTTRRG